MNNLSITRYFCVYQLFGLYINEPSKTSDIIKRKYPQIGLSEHFYSTTCTKRFKKPYVLISFLYSYTSCDLCT